MNYNYTDNEMFVCRRAVWMCRRPGFTWIRVIVLLSKTSATQILEALYGSGSFCFEIYFKLRMAGNLILIKRNRFQMD